MADALLVQMTFSLQFFSECKRCLNQGSEPELEMDEIFTGTEPETETKSNFIVLNRIENLKWPLTG